MGENESDEKQDKATTFRAWVETPIGTITVWAGGGVVLGLVLRALGFVGVAFFVLTGIAGLIVALIINASKKKSAAESANGGQLIGRDDVDEQLRSSGNSDAILRELSSIKNFIRWGVVAIGLILTIQTAILLALFSV